MAKTEEDALQQIFAEANRTSISRWSGWILSVFIVLVMLLLMASTYRQKLQTDQDAFAAHKREVRVQQALNTARRVQAIGAEQFLSFGARPSSDPCTPGDTPPSAACLKAIQQDLQTLIHGQFLSIRGLRRLRYASNLSSAEPSAAADRQTLQLLSHALLDLNALERWVLPLAETPTDVTSHSLYRRIVTEIQTGAAAHPDPRWSRVKARLLALPVAVSGAQASTCAQCADLVQALAEQPIRPEDTLEVYVWQAECLRKLPHLASTTADEACQTPSEPRTASALAPGEHSARRAFNQAVRWIENHPNLLMGKAPPRPGGAPLQNKVCSTVNIGAADGGDIGLRTFATTAARAFNGRAMTVLNTKQATAARLDRARDAIDKAICFRQAAQQTPAEVALSLENRAVIAYRRGYETALTGQVEAARAGFDTARCLAEAAVHDNVNLPWSWTIIYLTGALYQSPLSTPEKSCSDILSEADLSHGVKNYPIRRSSQVLRQLGFLAPEAYAIDELRNLLPILPSDHALNPTGYTTLDELINKAAEHHETYKSGEYSLLMEWNRPFVNMSKFWDAL